MFTAEQAASVKGVGQRQDGRRGAIGRAEMKLAGLGAAALKYRQRLASARGRRRGQQHLADRLVAELRRENVLPTSTDASSAK